MREVAATSSQDVGSGVKDAIGFDQTVDGGRLAKETLREVVEVRAQRRAAPAQVIEVESPARPRKRIHADKVVDVEGGGNAGTVDAVVADRDALQRSERVVDITLEIGKVKERYVLGFQKYVI